MIALVLPTFLAIFLALALGGSFAGWQTVRVRWWGLALLSLGVQLIINNPPFDTQAWALAWGPGIYLAALAGMLAAVVRNALERGSAAWPWRATALGIGLNLLVIAANGGFMPQSAEAYLAATGRVRVDTPGRLKNTAVMTDQSRLPWLSDVIPLPRWLPLTNVISLGDVFAAAGLAAWAFRTTMAVPRAATEAEAEAEAAPPRRRARPTPPRSGVVSG